MPNSERLLQTVNGGRTLLLLNCEGIRINDILVTPKVIEQDSQRWKGYSLSPGIGKDMTSLTDELLLRQIIYESMPIVILGEERLVLTAEVARFPYSIDGNQAFHSFAVRLYPESGKVSKVLVNRASTLAINEISASENSLQLDLGNGNLRLELLYERPELGTLNPLTPPSGFREEVVLQHR